MEMNSTSVNINRSELSTIFASLSMEDLAWAIKELTDRIVSAVPKIHVEKHDSRLSVTTWTEAGVSKDTAK